MICFRCKSEAYKLDKCPSCGADLHLFQRAVRLSNAYYNDGLQKAQVRNLSGAIVSLKGSLRLNKYNVPARTLLGLVYFEMGETVDALSEWVISKNFQEEGNPAVRYIEMMRKNRTTIKNFSQTIVKYNQALAYCRQGDLDLAFMQLKKVLQMNPKLIKAHQLMALLYIQQDKLELAKKSLRRAGRIDTNNTLTLRYLREINGVLRQQKGNSKNAGIEDDLIAYQNGNETIIMPKRFRESSFGASVAYILLGIVIGVCVVYYLVVPNIRSEMVQDTKQQLIEISEENSTNVQTIQVLENQLEKLQEQLDSATEDSEQVAARIDAYEKLLNAYEAYAKGNMVEAGERLAQVQKNFLSEESGKLFEDVEAEVSVQYLKQLYDDGYRIFSDGNFAEAVEKLKLVTDKDMGYEEGRAAYYLAQAYRRLDDMDAAVPYYQYVVENYPNTERGKSAQNYLSNQS